MTTSINQEKLELTLLMPCLNEANSLGLCVEKGMAALKRLGIEGEVLVADNGSTDGSQKIARDRGARVVSVLEKGYGNALRGGIGNAHGKYIIMGDADDSYDWNEIEPFVKKLRAGSDLVMGCRLPRGGGTIMPGAMPFLHRWLGNPVLSWIGRLFFNCPVTDFHCGLRGFSKAAIEGLQLRTTGMEFASEMVIKSVMNGLRIDETSITLHPDKRGRAPHLHTWRDGWRHLRFMMLLSPKWLFLFPGLFFLLAGIVGFSFLVSGTYQIAGVSFSINTLLVSALSCLVGFQCVAFWAMCNTLAAREKLFPVDPLLAALFPYIRLETGLIISSVAILGGLALLLMGVYNWSQLNFGVLSFDKGVRVVIPAVTLIALGLQGLFSSFMMSMLGMSSMSTHPPTTISREEPAS
ncbi:MAG: glycosyltransferase family 2 protein [Magnetococcus sp. THC-1_WYH]